MPAAENIRDQTSAESPGPVLSSMAVIKTTFSDLGVTPGNWSTLFGVPFIEAAHNLSNRPRTIFKSRWPNSPKHWEDLFAELGKWLCHEKQALFHRHATYQNELSSLSAALYPADPQPQNEKARSLLSWHLAKNYSRPERQKVLASIVENYQILEKTDAAKEFLEKAIEDLRPLIDDYLLPKAVFGEPSWAQWLRQVLGSVPDELPPPVVKDLLDCKQDEFASSLAKIPYKPRRQLLAELSLLFGQVFKDNPERIKRYFEELAYKTDEARQQQKVVSANEAQTNETGSESGNGSEKLHIPSPATLEVTEADTRSFRTVSWQTVRDRISAIDVASIERELPNAQLLFAAEHGSKVSRPGGKAVPSWLWFVGDIHADPLALENAWDFIAQESAREKQRPNVVFLGDFVDRGPYSHETLLRLFDLIVNNPGQVGVVVGNHDENFQWDQATDAFVSRIEPAEYTAELNAVVKKPGEKNDRVTIAKLAEKFFTGCPRAIFLPDGLLLAHGGFPHTDIQESLKSWNDLNRPQCLQDFVWLRASPNSRRKNPNRASRGCDFGYEDFARFCDHMKKLGQPVRYLLRGHDHVPERYLHYQKYTTHPVVTINTMCRRLDDESGEQFPKACLARFVKDNLLIYKLPINHEEIRQAFFTIESKSCAT